MYLLPLSPFRLYHLLPNLVALFVKQAQRKAAGIARAAEIERSKIAVLAIDRTRNAEIILLFSGTGKNAGCQRT